MKMASTLKLCVVIFLPLLVSTSDIRKKQYDTLVNLLDKLQLELKNKQHDELSAAASDASDEDDKSVDGEEMLEKEAMKIEKDGTGIHKSVAKKMTKLLRKEQTDSETTNNPLSTITEFSTSYLSDGSSSASVQPASPTSPSIPITASSYATAYDTDSPTPNPGFEDADLVKPLKALLNALRKKMSSTCLAVGQSCGFHHGRVECCRGLRCSSDWSGTCAVDCVAAGESCRQNWFCCDGRQCVATTIHQQTSLFTLPEVEYVCQ